MFQWLATRWRAMASTDSEVSSNDAEWWRALFDTPADGAAVVTSSTSLRVAAVYACTRLIAGAIASLPVDLYRRDDQWRSTKNNGDSNLWWLLNESSSDLYTSTALKEHLLTSMLLRGSGFAYIQRDHRGTPTALMPFAFDQVTVHFMPGRTPLDEARLTYTFTTMKGSVTVPQEDVIHLPGFGFNGMTGMSVIQYGAKNATGIAMRADDFAGKFFSQGATPQFALAVPGKMGQAQQEELRNAWQAKYTGRGPNGIPLVLTEGIDVKELSMTAEDAQLLESRKWQVEDIARAFGVPPHMIGATDKQTSFGAGLEQMSQAFVSYTLAPHIARLEDELNRKLFRTASRYVRINVDGLMRGDATARANYYKAALGGTQNPAWMSQNEVRSMENLPPLDDGDALAQPEPSPTA